MIALFVALYSLLCLCTAVKTSDIKELHVKTVKRGENVTMECNFNVITNKDNLVWYRQSFGKLPQLLAKPYSNALGYTFDEGFNDSRFNVTVNDQKFDLNINELREDDGGEYFCGELEGNTIRFTSGTRLEFQDEETKHHGSTRKQTDSVTLQCSNSSNVEGESCTENMRILFWLSISRIGVLIIMVITLTIFHMILKSAS
ncbi:uncharacterized protein LOC113547697 [Pangasianodon hypophthalmus]|uniref:uncharacterized protein LOC113547697 n=1 Tax=Pangasianodon hypophthalmus TaxID=310915 RepID=UPI000F00CA8C|nr:uncharacterized protein LOC113547697 [Pangasianodon hypophthalmus]